MRIELTHSKTQKTFHYFSVLFCFFFSVLRTASLEDYERTSKSLRENEIQDEFILVPKGSQSIFIKDLQKCCGSCAAGKPLEWTADIFGTVFNLFSFHPSTSFHSTFVSFDCLSTVLPKDHKNLMVEIWVLVNLFCKG